MTGPTGPTGHSRHLRRFAELDARTWHDLLRLRVDVFVVEQECAYPELDGRDVEADTLHLWEADSHGGVVGYLRLLADPDGVRRIGRLCVSGAHRGRGVAGALMSAALEACGAAPVVLDAQSYLAGWYAGFGFVPTGPEFLDDGIPHVPMRRD